MLHHKHGILQASERGFDQLAILLHIAAGSFVSLPGHCTPPSKIDSSPAITNRGIQTPFE
jgi:hypothetical protein